MGSTPAHFTHSFPLSCPRPGRCRAARSGHRPAHHRRDHPRPQPALSREERTHRRSFVSAAPFQTTKPGERVGGDLAISIPTARRQGTEQGHPLGTELKVLMLHGLLHLAGYDHETDAGRMHRRERKLRAEFSLPMGLIERADQPSSPRARRTDGAKLRSTRGRKR